MLIGNQFADYSFVSIPKFTYSTTIFNAYRNSTKFSHAQEAKHCWNISFDISKCAPQNILTKTCNITSVVRTMFSLSLFFGYVQSSLPNGSINQLPMNQINEKFQSAIDLLASDGMAFHLICTCDMKRNPFRRCQHFEWSREREKKNELKSIWLHVCVLSRASILLATHSNIRR